MDISKAADDILNNPRFEGAISTIKGITEWTDVGFATVITFVAFMIICVAMLKNVLAGAYCAYPKFWDHVNDAHKRKNGQSVIGQVAHMFQGGFGQIVGGQNAQGGGGSQSIGDMIYGIIPDIKHMTDFEEGTFSAKHYFVKAIPQMLICVCLGAFIYNGTYRDVAAMTVNFGTTLINRTLLEFDPIAMFDNFTGTAGRPVFGSDNAIDQRTKNQNAIATQLYTGIIGTYKDVKTAEQKRLLADKCDDAADRALRQLENLDWYSTVISATGDSNFTMKHASTWSSADRSAECAARVGKVQDNPATYQFAFCTSLDTMNIAEVSKEAHPEHGYIVSVLTFTQGDVQVQTEAAQDLALYISVTDQLDVAISANGELPYFSGLPTANGQKVTCPVTSGSGELKMMVSQIDGDNSHRRITFEGNADTSGEVVFSMPTAVTVTTSNGGVKTEHTVRYIVLNGGKSGGFVESRAITEFGFQYNAAVPMSYTDAVKKHNAGPTE